MLLFLKIFFSYLFALNIIVYGLFILDKQRAIFSGKRIPEALLLVLSGLGGAYGAGAAMALYNHKTRKVLFLTLVPIFFVLWIIGLVFLALMA